MAKTRGVHIRGRERRKRTVPQMQARRCTARATRGKEDVPDINEALVKHDGGEERKDVAQEKDAIGHKVGAVALHQIEHKCAAGDEVVDNEKVEEAEGDSGGETAHAHTIRERKQQKGPQGTRGQAPRRKRKEGDRNHTTVCQLCSPRPTANRPCSALPPPSTPRTVRISDLTPRPHTHLAPRSATRCCFSATAAAAAETPPPPPLTRHAAPHPATPRPTPPHPAPSRPIPLPQRTTS